MPHLNGCVKSELSRRTCDDGPVSAHPTMNDVAREAGVALRTVSRYVNGARNIDPQLAERIRDAITRLGYRRNLSAASIRPGWSSKTIGLITSDLANPYFAALARAVERAAAVAGYMVMASSSEEDGGRHDRIVDRMIDQRVDGMIVVPPRRAGRAWSEVSGPLPPVVFTDRPADLAGAPSVLADNRGGARSAVMALHAAGARRIAFVGDARSVYTMNERHQGYVGALAELGLPVTPSLVIDGAHSAAEAAGAVRLLLEAADADAIFAANNRAAFGAVSAFRDTGRRIGLVGFDDFEAAALLTPAVSVVNQDVAQMGELATELLLAAIAGDPVAPPRRMLPTELILRGSERGE